MRSQKVKGARDLGDLITTVYSTFDKRRAEAVLRRAFKTPQVVRDLVHRQGSGPGQKLRERAVVSRIEMLHQHKAHSRVGRQILEQVRERLQTARGRANSNNRKPGSSGRG